MTLFFKNKLLTSTATFTIANIIDKGLPFLILPLITAAMPPEEYSLIALFTGIFVITSFTVGINASGYVGVSFFKKPKTEFQGVVFNAVLVFVVSALLNLIFITIASDFFSKKSGLSLNYLFLSIVASLGLGIQSVALSIFRAEKKAIPYALLQVGRSALDVTISLYLVLQINLSWLGRIWGISMANIIIGLVSLLIIYRKNLIQTNFSFKLIKEILSFGAPLLPHAIANWSLTMSDRFFINHFVGAKENGMFSLGFTLGMALAVLTQSFNQAWSPHLFDILNRQNFNEKLKTVKFTYFYFVAILLGATLFALVAESILKLFFSSAYYDSSKYILPISISYAFDGMYLIVSNYIFYSGKTYLLSIGSGTVAIIKLGLSYYLIKNLGASGAIYSSMISFFLLFLFTFIIAMRVEKMPWNLHNT